MGSVENWILSIGICHLLAMPAPAAVHHPNPDTAGFTLVKTSGDIAVYERWYTVRPGKMAREIKATMFVSAGAPEAAALLKDESSGRKWNPNVETYKVILSNESSWVCYVQYDLPWPVSNQDCVLQYRQYDCGSSIEILFKGIEHGAFPARRPIDRIADIRGRWIFTDTGGGILVEHYISTTPSTRLPAWLTDPIIRNNLLETMASFRRILEADNDN